MKAAAGDKAPLWVVYQPEIYNTLIITTLFEVLPTFYQKMEQSLEVEMPPFVGEIAEVDFPPAYFLARRNSDAILTQGRSTFGLVSSQMILSLKEVLVEEMAAEDLEFHEGEF